MSTLDVNRILATPADSTVSLTLIDQDIATIDNAVALLNAKKDALVQHKTLVLDAMGNAWGETLNIRDLPIQGYTKDLLTKVGLIKTIDIPTTEKELMALDSGRIGYTVIVDLIRASHGAWPITK